MELNAEQVKDWVQELILKNRILEEENKLLISKLKNSGHGDVDGQEDLHSKIQVLVEEVKDLKCGQTNLHSRIQNLEKEVKFLKLNNLELTEGFTTHGLQSSNEGQIATVVEHPNPLMREEILRLVFCHVKPMDLLNCRQVCRLWRNTCRKSMEEKVTFQISRFNLSEIKLFMNYAIHSFPNFRNLDLDLDCDWSEKDIRSLFRHHGKYLRKLKLYYQGGLVDDLVEEDFFRSVFLYSLEEVRDLQINFYCKYIHEPQYRRCYPPRVKQILPNLKTLNLGLNNTPCRPYGQDHDDMRIDIFNDILEISPNVHTIHWRSWKFNDDNYHDGSFDFIQPLLRINPPQLENLFIHGLQSFEFIKSIRDSELKLKQLYIMDCHGFTLHLISNPSTKSTFTPKPGSQHFETFQGSVLKTDLEGEFAKHENVSCTKLLQVFTTTLDNHH